MHDAKIDRRDRGDDQDGAREAFADRPQQAQERVRRIWAHYNRRECP